MAYSSPDVVSDQDSAVDLRKSASRDFGLEIWNYFFLGWFLECDALEVEVGVGRPLRSNK
jgi:hypothetical protein